LPLPRIAAVVKAGDDDKSIVLDRKNLRIGTISSRAASASQTPRPSMVEFGL
jgi:hypothetical protein